MVQLLHEGPGPTGIPEPQVVVHDVDPLDPQGLHLYVATTPRPLVAMLLHVGCHALKDVGI